MSIGSSLFENRTPYRIRPRGSPAIKSILAVRQRRTMETQSVVSISGIQSGKQIISGVVEENAPWIKEGCGFKSLNDFNKRLELLPSKER